NASIDGTNIVYKKDINLGMAVDLGHGLIVPVIKHADQLSLSGLAKGANDLADRARNKKLKPDEVQGGTFTITNPGVFGSLFGTPVINQPQVAILGVGAVEKRPVVIPDADGNDSIAIKTMCYFAITYDHRLVDGADADRFMIEVKKTLETDTWTELDAYSKREADLVSTKRRQGRHQRRKLSDELRDIVDRQFPDPFVSDLVVGMDQDVPLVDDGPPGYLRVLLLEAG